MISDVAFSHRMGDIYCFVIGVPVMEGGEYVGCLRAIIDTNRLITSDHIASPYGDVVGSFLTDERGNIIDAQVEDQRFASMNTVSEVADRLGLELTKRERRNLEQSIALCQELQGRDIPVEQLDTQWLLNRMEELEKGGTSFRNQQAQDVRVSYIAPVIVTVLMVALMIALSALLLWAYWTDPGDAPPFWFLFVLIGILAAVGIGVILALLQRIREIGKGEMDDARKY